MSDAADSCEVIRFRTITGVFERRRQALRPCSDTVACSNVQLWPPRTVKRPTVLVYSPLPLQLAAYARGWKPRPSRLPLVTQPADAYS